MSATGGRTGSTLLLTGLLLGGLGCLGGSGAHPAVAADPTTVGGDLLASAGVVVNAPGAAALPEVKAASWVLSDLETGEVLAARNPHARLRPASTLKILTALAVLPRLDPAATYTAQWEDANVEGSKVGLVPDATYTVHDLFEALFLVSGNDAASALANAAGGMEPTVALMNRTAADLGALDTTVVNPSGLDAPGQLTSAYDMSVVTRTAMAREDFRAYATTVTSQFPGKMPRAGKVRKTYEIYTQDRLLLNYRGAIGVKTGWTTKARGTFVGAATRGGRTLVATVLNTDVDAWRESAALLTWGFRNAALVEPVGTLDAVAAPDAGTPAGPRAASASAPVAGAREGRSDGGGLPWALQATVVAVAVAVLLRARVLLRRRFRRSRVRLESMPVASGPRPTSPRTVTVVAAPRSSRVPQPRDLRRDTTEATAAPRPAPTRTPRARPPGRDATAASSTSSGTAS